MRTTGGGFVRQVLVAAKTAFGSRPGEVRVASAAALLPREVREGHHVRGKRGVRVEERSVAVGERGGLEPALSVTCRPQPHREEAGEGRHGGVQTQEARHTAEADLAANPLVGVARELSAALAGVEERAFVDGQKQLRVLEVDAFHLHDRGPDHDAVALRQGHRLLEANTVQESPAGAAEIGQDEALAVRADLGVPRGRDRVVEGQLAARAGADREAFRDSFDGSGELTSLVAALLDRLSALVAKASGPVHSSLRPRRSSARSTRSPSKIIEGGIRSIAPHGQL